MARASLQRRLFVGAAIWIVLALVTTAVVLSVLFRDHLENELARRLDADFLQLVSQFDVDAQGRLLHPVAMSDPLYQRVLSGRYWQIERAGAVSLRSRSLWDARLETNTQHSGDRIRMNGPRGQPLLAVVRQITLPDVDEPLRLTVAASLSPVDAAVADFRRTTLIALGVLAAGLILAAALQVRLGLRPLGQLRGELARIRANEATRLSGDYPAEVAPLVADLNSVLAHNETLIERARRQAGNLAHALKTPLSIIDNEAQRMGQDGETRRAARLGHEVVAMQRHIDWHLARTRIAGRAGHGLATPVDEVMARLQRTLQRLYGERGVIIEIEADPAVRFAGEQRDLEQMLGNLMENACKWARGVVQVSATADADTLVLHVDDDGPGMRGDQREQAIQPGQRFDETVPGSGLGLAIVSDLAEAYGGELILERAGLGGLSARLRLPKSAGGA
ncbi:integral membrane sensor signal transduction histidine kinase [Salinisphaera sp. S4-8]|uniref:sensor histidine kinase n=1 Tax=Salinisphaera sp. S4-8 TaxID=633357 RepID=UPI003340825B